MWQVRASQLVHGSFTTGPKKWPQNCRFAFPSNTNRKVSPSHLDAPGSRFTNKLLAKAGTRLLPTQTKVVLWQSTFLRRTAKIEDILKAVQDQWLEILTLPFSCFRLGHQRVPGAFGSSSALKRRWEYSVCSWTRCAWRPNMGSLWLTDTPIYYVQIYYIYVIFHLLESSSGCFPVKPRRENNMFSLANGKYECPFLRLPLLKGNQKNGAP